MEEASVEMSVSGGEFNPASGGYNEGVMGDEGKSRRDQQPEKKVYEKIEAWRNRRIAEMHPYFLTWPGSF